MTRADVLLVDYGMGNLRSVERAFARTGAAARVSDDPDAVRRAGRLVVPGVGAMGDCMRRLRERGLAEALLERIRAGVPYLGICLGLQVLLEEGEEGGVTGLGLVKGRVRRFPESLDVSVPHMGWNSVELRSAHPVVSEGFYYFVHAFRAQDVDPACMLGTTEYGERFPSVLAGESWVAVQFHPEKSQRAGLGILERFLAWSP